MKNIYIASDHAGFNLKESIKKKYSKKYNLFDLGPNKSSKSVNYPDYAHKLSKKINKKQNIGILVCGSGMGMSMSANRTKDIRAALCLNTKMAELSRQHNNANILVLGSRLISVPEAIKCLLVFLNTKFEGGRHQGRLNKFNNVDYNIT